MNINESPITHDMQDLNDFSIHEPSIRPGDRVSGLDKWIEENQCRDQWSDLVVPVIDLREFMKGKVLVDAFFLERVLDCASAAEGNDEYTNKCIAELRAALHPTSSGDKP